MFGQLAILWPVVPVLAGFAVFFACREAKAASRRAPVVWSVVVVLSAAMMCIGLVSTLNRHPGVDNPGGPSIGLSELMLFGAWVLAFPTLLVAALVPPRIESQRDRWLIRGLLLAALGLTVLLHWLDHRMRMRVWRQERGSSVTAFHLPASA